MTVALTIHLFQAVYTGHGYFGKFWEIATYISVMVNGHYIHFYKNKYKLTPILLIHLFQPPMQASVWVNGTTCSVTVKLGYFDQNFSSKFIYFYILCSGCFSFWT